MITRRSRRPSRASRHNPCRIADRVARVVRFLVAVVMATNLLGLPSSAHVDCTNLRRLQPGCACSLRRFLQSSKVAIFARPAKEIDGAMHGVPAPRSVERRCRGLRGESVRLSAQSKNESTAKTAKDAKTGESRTARWIQDERGDPDIPATVARTIVAFLASFGARLSGSRISQSCVTSS
jgi:hypothetical protein